MNHISFDATINAGKTEITIIPEPELQPYTGYVLIVKDIEDYSNNTLGGNIAKSYFTTGASQHSSIVSEARNEYTVYPNPFKGEFVIDFGSAETRKIEIYDFTGNIVFYTISHGESHKVNLGKLSPGIYFIKINKLNSPENILLKLINK